MNSYLWLTLAPDRARDMRTGAAPARDHREARRARRARRRARVTEPAVHGQAPDSYEDFLGQAARPAMREPAAAGGSARPAAR